MQLQLHKKPFKNTEKPQTHMTSRMYLSSCENAVYYFSDETIEGREQLKFYFEKTWNYIRDEVYSLHDVNWVALDKDTAVCIYQFHWSGNIKGRQKEGNGRGTNVFQRFKGSWKIVHEHLSTLDE
ncbi:MAG TPA: nuclear transport factor 2 family protein [Bacillales bacterium]